MKNNRKNLKECFCSTSEKSWNGGLTQSDKETLIQYAEWDRSEGVTIEDYDSEDLKELLEKICPGCGEEGISYYERLLVMPESIFSKITPTKSYSDSCCSTGEDFLYDNGEKDFLYDNGERYWDEYVFYEKQRKPAKASLKEGQDPRALQKRKGSLSNLITEYITKEYVGELYNLPKNKANEELIKKVESFIDLTDKDTVVDKIVNDVIPNMKRKDFERNLDYLWRGIVLKGDGLSMKRRRGNFY